MNRRAEKHYIIGYGFNQWKLLDPVKFTITWARDIRVVEDLKDQSAKIEIVDEEQLEFQNESNDNDSIISQSHDLKTSIPFHSLFNILFEGVVEKKFSNEFSNKFLNEKIENEKSKNENSQIKHDQGTFLKNFISQLKKMTFIADDPKTYKKNISDDNAHLWKKTMIKHLVDLNKLKT